MNKQVINEGSVLPMSGERKPFRGRDADGGRNARRARLRLRQALLDGLFQAALQRDSAVGADGA